MIEEKSYFVFANKCYPVVLTLWVCFCFTQKLFNHTGIVDFNSKLAVLYSSQFKV